MAAASVTAGRLAQVLVEERPHQVPRDERHPLGIDGTDGERVSSGPRSSPRSLKSRCWLPAIGDLLRVPRGLDGREVRVGGLAEPIALPGLIVPEDEARCRQAGVPDVGPQGAVEIHRGGAPCVLSAGLERRGSAHRVAEVGHVVEVECADRRRVGSQRLDDEGRIGDPHVRDRRGRVVPAGDVAQERRIDATEGGRGHHVAVRELHEGGAGGVDADDRVAVAGEVLGQRRVGRDGLTKARQQHDHRRVTVERRAGDRVRPDGVQVLGHDPGAVREVRPGRRQVRRGGAGRSLDGGVPDPDRELSRAAIGGEGVGPGRIRQRELGPTHERTCR